LPLASFIGVAIARFFRLSLSERGFAVLVESTFAIAMVSVLGVVVAMLIGGHTSVTVPLGTWFRAGDHAFRITLLVDRLSVPFLFLSTMLSGTVGAFAARYLHREPGQARFMSLLLLFAGGIALVTTAGGLDVAYAGWELVGLSSALLIAFFNEREAPVHHGLWAFGVYRACDVGLLLAALLAHAYAGSADYAVVYGAEPWPSGTPGIGGGAAAAVVLLLLFAAMGKSAQVPFSGWLPRAMEGPTPSSAIFYGALSVHAGCYVLLRAGPLLEREPWASAALVGVGLSTALYATVVGRAQTDIKTSIAYAALTQLGLIIAEIGLGLRFVALAHIVGHALMRSLQFLRAPSLLHERHQLEAAIGEHVTRTGAHLEKNVPTAAQLWLYRFALQRGYLDALIIGWLVAPVVRVFRFFDRLERRFTDFIAR
jgi:NAD(P)H-quinone oxidoreductase subunit 5